MKIKKAPPQTPSLPFIGKASTFTKTDSTAAVYIKGLKFYPKQSSIVNKVIRVISQEQKAQKAQKA